MPDGHRAYRVRLQDEAPRIGSGERLVDAKVGRKWVHLRPHNSHRHWSRLTLQVWRAIPKWEHEPQEATQ